jgi:large subunit ribosomal protein L21
MKRNVITESYAIFQTGGKQYQAVIGKTVAIEKLSLPADGSVVFDEVLLRKVTNERGEPIIEVGQPFVSSPVKAHIIKHMRGPKLIAFKFKRRKKYKRKQGHRQPATIVRIDSI